MNKINVLGILPARSGSKGIKNKNTKVLAGKTLIEWAAESIIGVSHISRAICSTDDHEIARIARKCGLEVPFMRPKEFATDTSPTVDAIYHALNVLNSSKKPFTHIALVQATSPTVTKKDVINAIELSIKNDADTVISGYKVDHTNHPAIMYTVGKSGRVNWVMKDHYLNRRQDFPTVFVRTGLVYVVKTNVINNKKSLYGDVIHTMVIDKEKAITIDDVKDLQTANKYLKQK